MSIEKPDENVEEIFAQYISQVENKSAPNWDVFLKANPDISKELAEFKLAFDQIRQTFYQNLEEHPLKIHQYEIIEKIGQGGMGAVYKAFDTNLKRQVAIKASLENVMWLGIQEGRAMAKLQHKYLAQVYDCIRFDDSDYLVMEYVEGQTIDKFQGQVSISDIVDIFIKICSGIEEAHRQSLLHCDIKPANILLNKKLEPKVVDFGLSQTLSANKKVVLRGTPEFMAPEILFEQAEADQSTDVYSIGICLYYMLTGHLPFANAAIDFELLQKMKNYDFKLPKLLNAEIPSELQNIVLKAFEYNRNDRYQGVADLKIELKSFLNNDPISAKPTAYKHHLEQLVASHLTAIESWQNQSLVSKDESAVIQNVYKGLLAKEHDWVLDNRKLSVSQNSLYLGLWVTVLGGILFFYGLYYPQQEREYRRSVFDSPSFIFFVDCICLVFGWFFWVKRSERIGLALMLLGMCLLPVVFLGFFKHFALFEVNTNLELELFEENLWLTNLQLFYSFSFSTVICFLINLRLKTKGSSFACVFFLFLSFLMMLFLLGLKVWVLKDKWVWFSFWSLGLSVFSFLIAFALEWKNKAYMADPFYWLFLLGFMLGCVSFAINGAGFDFLGIGLQSQYSELSSEELMVLHQNLLHIISAFIFYFVGSLIIKLKTNLSFKIGQIIIFFVPYFALLPLAYLSRGFAFGFLYDALHICMALSVLYLSVSKQKKNYFYSGILNVGLFVFIFGNDYHMFENLRWSKSLVVIGLFFVLMGIVLGRLRVSKSEG